MPVKAGIQGNQRSACRFWIPAFAGMTLLRARDARLLGQIVVVVRP
jgi:hypothetical protein